MYKLTKVLSMLAVILLATTATRGQTQAQMNQEACNKYTKADVEMNRAYAQILNEYKKDSVFIEKLKKAQRAWIEYRDAHLESLYPNPERLAYGSVNPMCRCMVLAELTNDRTAVLKRWIRGIEEGDVCYGSIKIRK